MGALGAFQRDRSVAGGAADLRWDPHAGADGNQVQRPYHLRAGHDKVLLALHLLREREDADLGADEGCAEPAQPDHARHLGLRRCAGQDHPAEEELDVRLDRWVELNESLRGGIEPGAGVGFEEEMRAQLRALGYLDDDEG